MSYFGLILIAQIACAVHVIRTGRQLFWIFLIIFVPLVGIVVYFIIEILPGLMGSVRAQRAASGVAHALNPGRNLREAERRMAMTPSAQNKADLAEAYLAVGRSDEALDLFRGALTGIYASDPTMLLGLARTHVARREFADAQKILQQLRQTDPDRMTPEARLLLAQSLAGQGHIEEALEEYRTLVPIFPGQEARYRCGILLRQSGREDEARRLFQEICQAAKFAPRHVGRLEKEWFDLARHQLTQ